MVSAKHNETCQSIITEDLIEIIVVTSNIANFVVSLHTLYIGTIELNPL